MLFPYVLLELLHQAVSPVGHRYFTRDCECVMAVGAPSRERIGIVNEFWHGASFPQARPECYPVENQTAPLPELHWACISRCLHVLVLLFSGRSHSLHESSRTGSGRNGSPGGANTESRSSHATRVRLEIPGNQPR